MLRTDFDTPTILCLNSMLAEWSSTKLNQSLIILLLWQAKFMYYGKISV